MTLSNSAQQCRAHCVKAKAMHRVPPSMLLVGPAQAMMTQLMTELQQLLLCTAAESPCNKCRSCLLRLANNHPDLVIIAPETPQAALKIEQIRTLNTTLYQRPDHAPYRIICINSAHKLNLASANALLKILEEPPAQTVFILNAAHLSTLPATILSRCQQWFIHPDTALSLQDIIAGDDGLERLISEQSRWLEQLHLLLEKKQSITTTAQYFATVDLLSVMTYLYAFAHECLKYKLSRAEAEPSERHLMRYLSTYHLLQQIDEINAIKKKVNHTIMINPLLAIERIVSYYTYEDELERL